MQTVETPETAGLDAERWQHALNLLEGWTAERAVPAAGLLVAHHGKTTGPHLFGTQLDDETSPPVRDDAIFLIASITKPIVAMGAMLLVERGLLTLDDRVKSHVPEFARHGKHAVTIRHLMTHTSGLPDMLANNLELRTAGAPLSDFVAGTCEQELAFQSGREIKYQSMGFAMLGEVIHRITGTTCAEFLRQEFFEPLGMHDTALGAPDDWFDGADPKADRIAAIRLPPNQRADDRWNWNQRYWRQLGAPWGGLLTTPADLGRFAEMMLNEGAAGNRQILSRATVRAATCNQLAVMRETPEFDRRCRPWGLGWRLNWPADSANFGDLLGPATYGHWGATGTALWIDPDSRSFLVLLTTLPQEPRGYYLARTSNAVAAALLK